MNKQQHNRQNRNLALRDFFETLGREFPEWRYDVLIKRTAEAFHLSPQTVERIIKDGYNKNSPQA
jgi:hypothetical protein